MFGLCSTASQGLGAGGRAAMARARGYRCRREAQATFWGILCAAAKGERRSEWKNVSQSEQVGSESNGAARTIRIESLGQFPVALLDWLHELSSSHNLERIDPLSPTRAVRPYRITPPAVSRSPVRESRPKSAGCSIRNRSFAVCPRVPVLAKPCECGLVLSAPFGFGFGLAGGFGVGVGVGVGVVCVAAGRMVSVPVLCAALRTPCCAVTLAVTT